MILYFIIQLREYLVLPSFPLIVMMQCKLLSAAKGLITTKECTSQLNRHWQKAMILTNSPIEFSFSTSAGPQRVITLLADLIPPEISTAVGLLWVTPDLQQCLHWCCVCLQEVWSLFAKTDGWVWSQFQKDVFEFATSFYPSGFLTSCLGRRMLPAFCPFCSSTLQGHELVT